MCRQTAMKASCSRSVSLKPIRRSDHNGAIENEPSVANMSSACVGTVEQQGRTLVDRNAVARKVVRVEPTLALGDADADLSVE